MLTCKNTKRGGKHIYVVQDGWTDDGRRITREIVTDWLPIKCGCEPKNYTSDCDGCRNKDE